SACGVCHESEHRATMVPDLHKIQQETNAEFWRNWITHGKPESLMPAFAKSEGGILSDAQIESLVNYLVAAVPSHATAQAIPGTSKGTSVPTPLSLKASSSRPPPPAEFAESVPIPGADTCPEHGQGFGEGNTRRFGGPFSPRQLLSTESRLRLP